VVSPREQLDAGQLAARSGRARIASERDWIEIRSAAGWFNQPKPVGAPSASRAPSRCGSSWSRTRASRTAAGRGRPSCSPASWCLCGRPAGQDSARV